MMSKPAKMSRRHVFLARPNVPANAISMTQAEESPQREGEDPSARSSADVKGSVTFDMLLLWAIVTYWTCCAHRRNGWEVLLFLPSRCILFLFDPIHFETAFCSWRYHSCLSMISWSLVITGRPCVYIYTLMLLRHQWCWWHMQVSNLLKFIQAPVTICS